MEALRFSARVMLGFCGVTIESRRARSFPVSLERCPALIVIDAEEVVESFGVSFSHGVSWSLGIGDVEVSWRPFSRGASSSVLWVDWGSWGFAFVHDELVWDVLPTRVDLSSVLGVVLCALLFVIIRTVLELEIVWDEVAVGVWLLGGASATSIVLLWFEIGNVESGVSPAALGSGCWWRTVASLSAPVAFGVASGVAAGKIEVFGDVDAIPAEFLSFLFSLALGSLAFVSWQMPLSVERLIVGIPWFRLSVSRWRGHGWETRVKQARPPRCDEGNLQ
jgi:hypothetical protein